MDGDRLVPRAPEMNMQCPSVSDEFCSILESGKMGLSSQRVECNTEINSQPSILLPLAARSHDSYLFQFRFGFLSFHELCT